MNPVTSESQQPVFSKNKRLVLGVVVVAVIAFIGVAILGINRERLLGRTKPIMPSTENPKSNGRLNPTEDANAGGLLTKFSNYLGLAGEAKTRESSIPLANPTTSEGRLFRIKEFLIKRRIPIIIGLILSLALIGGGVAFTVVYVQKLQAEELSKIDVELPKEHPVKPEELPHTTEPSNIATGLSNNERTAIGVACTLAVAFVLASIIVRITGRITCKDVWDSLTACLTACFFGKKNE